MRGMNELSLSLLLFILIVFSAGCTLNVNKIDQGDKQGVTDIMGHITNSENSTENCYLSGECETSVVEKENFKILLKSRQFRPNPGIEYSLYSKLPVLEDRDRIQVFIQFESMPNESKKEELSKKNIQLSAYIPHDTWIASIPPEDIIPLIFDPYIRWIGDVKAVDKTSRRVQEENFNSTAVNRNENVTLAVIFLSEVTKAEVEEILYNYNASLVYMGDLTGYGPGMLNDYLVSIQRKFVYDFASEYDISWVE